MNIQQGIQIANDKQSKIPKLLFCYLLTYFQVLAKPQAQEQPSCDELMKYFPNQVHPDFGSFLSQGNTSLLVDTFGHKEYYIKPRVFFVNGTKPYQQFVISSSLKGGTTRTFQLIQKVLNKEYDGVFSFKIYQSVQDQTNMRQLDVDTINNILRDPQIPRILIVRDPYIRLVSGYKEKINTKRFNRGLGFHPDQKNITFDEFVERVYNYRYDSHRGVTSHGSVNPHFASQVELTMIYLGMKYNYVLKLEQMGDWFPCLVDKLNIREEMMHGWPGKDECFLSTTADPCNGPFEASGILENVHDYASHYQGSGSEVGEYYKNDTTLRYTTEMFQNDLVTFNYKFMLPK